MKYKVGQELYQCMADEDDEKVVMDTYVVRSIKKGVAYATLYWPGVTWVKLSTKHGDFGWATSIPDWMRKASVFDGKFLGLHTTKRQALVAEAMSIKKGSVTDDKAVADKLMATIRRMITKEKGKK